MSGPTELFTVQSLITLQGGALAAIIVPGSLSYFMNLNKQWQAGIAFLIAEFVAYLGAFISEDGDPLKWVIAAFNGFVIFSAAMGQNQGTLKLAQHNGWTEGPGVKPAEGLGRAPSERWGIISSWL